MSVAMQKTGVCNLHGCTFETSPNPRIGDVSNDCATTQHIGKLPNPKTGTAVAINYIRLGVGANLPCNSGRGGARNRADRESHALSNGQIANLRAAECHSRAIGLPFNRMITIHWQAAGLPLSGMVKATGRFVDLLSKVLARNGHRTSWLWVHENGDRKGWHCHLLVYVPANRVKRVSELQKGWLRRISGKPYKAGVILSKPIGGRLGLEVGNPELHSTNLEVAFGYVCKGAPQSLLDAHCIERLHEAGGRIIGKRCATSQNIGAKARATWQGYGKGNARNSGAE